MVKAELTLADSRRAPAGRAQPPAAPEEPGDNDGNAGALAPERPRGAVLRHADGGLFVGARILAEDDQHHGRITPWIRPCFTQVPPRGDHPMHGYFWVPIDHHHNWAWSFDYHPMRPLKAEERQAMIDGQGIHVNDVPGTFIPAAHKSNNYLMDRAALKSGLQYSGIEGIAMQDAFLQESMRAIQDRRRENLFSTDHGIIMMRQRLIKAARALAEKGEPPPGTLPEHQRVRSAALLLKRHRTPHQNPGRNRTMSPTKLKTVTRTQGNNAALKDGSVQPAGFEFDFEEVPVLTDGFRRMVRGLEFDVCEMALTTYVCARAHGKRFTALPVFLVRAFHHGAIVINTDLGIQHPKDLEGRRVGVNRGWTVTTGLWARSVLQHQYGVDLTKITWVLSGDEHVAEYRPPGYVEPIAAGRKMDDLVVGGELAGAIGVEINAPNVKPLIADAQQVGLQALRETGHYPINHLVVVKDEVLQTHPGVAAAVFEAFAECKRRYVRQLRADTLANPTAVDQLHRRVMDLTGADPLPYGIEPNRRVLETALASAVEQGIIDRAPVLEELFAAGTHGLHA